MMADTLKARTVNKSIQIYLWTEVAGPNNWFSHAAYESDPVTHRRIGIYFDVDDYLEDYRRTHGR